MLLWANGGGKLVKHGYKMVWAATALALGVAPWSASAAELKGQQGLDMMLIDAEAMPQEPELAADVPQSEDVSWSGAPVDLLKPIHHIYTDLRRQLIKYQMTWSSLPQVRVPEAGHPLDAGASNSRISTLRERLGLTAAGSYDPELQGRVVAFQAAHGLEATGKADAQTLVALNRGAAYYERRLLLNMERARRLPPPGGSVSRYILVDVGSARLWMYEQGQPVDTMKVIVGKAASETPMMAALLRYASVNPYWNVPPDLVASLIAPKVIAGGASYLKDRRYEVLDSWESDAKVIDLGTVDWQAVASGKQELRVRQLPGGANSMGAIKFMLPNEYGIYLHDTPNKAVFADDNRWVSNGCVRLEDAARLARWVFGEMPRGANSDQEDYVPLEKAIPVYMTYLTVGSAANGPVFRADPYDRDRVVLERFAAAGDGMKDATRNLALAPKEQDGASTTLAKPVRVAASAPGKRATPARPELQIDWGDSAERKATGVHAVASTFKLAPSSAAKPTGVAPKPKTGSGTQTTKAVVRNAKAATAVGLAGEAHAQAPASTTTKATSAAVTGAKQVARHLNKQSSSKSSASPRHTANSLAKRSGKEETAPVSNIAGPKKASAAAPVQKPR